VVFVLYRVETKETGKKERKAKTTRTKKGTLPDNGSE
jgi:hypothetical protein